MCLTNPKATKSVDVIYKRLQIAAQAKPATKGKGKQQVETHLTERISKTKPLRDGLNVKMKEISESLEELISADKEVVWAEVGKGFFEVSLDDGFMSHSAVTDGVGRAVYGDNRERSVRSEIEGRSECAESTTGKEDIDAPGDRALKDWRKEIPYTCIVMLYTIKSTHTPSMQSWRWPVRGGLHVYTTRSSQECCMSRVPWIDAVKSETIMLVKLLRPHHCKVSVNIRII